MLQHLNTEEIEYALILVEWVHVLDCITAADYHDYSTCQVSE